MSFFLHPAIYLSEQVSIMISVYVCFVVNRLTVTLYIAVRVFLTMSGMLFLETAVQNWGVSTYMVPNKYWHSQTVVHLHLNERNVCSTTSREWIGLPKEGRPALTRFLAGVWFVPAIPGAGSGSLWWMNERFWKVSMT